MLKYIFISFVRTNEISIYQICDDPLTSLFHYLYDVDILILPYIHVDVCSKDGYDMPDLISYFSFLLFFVFSFFEKRSQQKNYENLPRKTFQSTCFRCFPKSECQINDK